MPPVRKRRSTHDEIIAPGGGNQSDVLKLAKNLNMSTEETIEMLTSNGSGLGSARSSRRASTEGAAEGNASTVAAQSSAWADFMDEEGFGKDAEKTDESSLAKKAKVSSSNALTSTSASSSGESVRDYFLPLKPTMRPPSLTSKAKKTKSSTNSNQDAESYYSYITPGILAQTGSLDAKMVGRTKRTLDQTFDLQEPTILALESSFGNQKVACIATSSSACHSIVILEDGTAYAWGRNEEGQCGLGMTSACVPLPTKIELSGKFVGAAVGKNHSILIEEGGIVYAVGNNKYGQCGVNRKDTNISTWRKCTMENVKIVQVCFLNFMHVLIHNSSDFIMSHHQIYLKIGILW